MQFLANLHANKQPLQELPSSQQGFSTAYMAGIHSISFPHSSVANSICCTCKMNGSFWIVDSGASDHMIFDETLLHNLRPLKDSILITLPNGNKVKVSQVGDLKIGKNLTLHHALFVPYFQFNLLSVKRLSEQLKCEVVFSEHSCFLQGPSLKRPLEIGRPNQGLYILDDEVARRLVFDPTSDFLPYSDKIDKTVVPCLLSCNESKSVFLWHKRMGHVSFRKLKYMHVLQGSFSEIKTNIDVTPCDICPRAKQERRSFHNSCISSTKAFELIHVDTWGPYHTKTHHG